MCRVCLKRPPIEGERFGRCEACARAGRAVYRFRVGPGRVVGSGLVVRAGELSPRALHDKLRRPIGDFTGRPAAKPHLGLHEVEMVLARDRLESVRLAPDLRERGEEVMSALRAAAERTEASW